MQKMILKSATAIGLAISSFTAATLLPSGAAFAEAAVHPVVLARDAHGRATEVQVNGKDYKVCSATLQDECINPRQAGLNFGNRPLPDWPGQPASELKG